MRRPQRLGWDRGSGGGGEQQSPRSPLAGGCRPQLPFRAALASPFPCMGQGINQGLACVCVMRAAVRGRWDTFLQHSAFTCIVSGDGAQRWRERGGTGRNEDNKPLWVPVGIVIGYVCRGHKGPGRGWPAVAALRKQALAAGEPP